MYTRKNLWHLLITLDVRSVYDNAIILRNLVFKEKIHSSNLSHSYISAIILLQHSAFQQIYLWPIFWAIDVIHGCKFIIKRGIPCLHSLHSPVTKPSYSRHKSDTHVNCRGELPLGTQYLCSIQWIRYFFLTVSGSSDQTVIESTYYY